jgi:hypothetical protein
MKNAFRAAVIGLLVASARLAAHHAFDAEYDEHRVVKVSGHVTRFEWSNPHAWLYVEGSDASGKPGTWNFEMGSPNGLLHRGWTKLALKKGDEVTVEGFGAKDGSNIANASRVTMPDGKQLFGGFQSTPRLPAK